ncbi:hypothetical protein IT774_10235 [Salinimonas marina]|uniref:Uncharacterized protein n=1 Tax=Salinimonas marina TaxID=2785918 RepID=A0A7S9HC89_9ALTE|nr:hypothetical protein [Salinimonas marina]QPG04612.1 hypothetical protein IT774_10235 [Salinimonas marina]
MGIRNYLGVNIMAALGKLKNKIAMLEYVKIDSDEFLKAPESGFYLQSKDSSGVISGCRIFIKEDEPYLPASENLKGEYKNFRTLNDLEKKYGPAIKDIPSVKIPGVKPTLPGKKFEDGDVAILAHYSADKELVFIHLKMK